jgi:septum formation protein
VADLGLAPLTRLDPGVPRLVLASASPARLSTLRGAGIDPEVVVSHVDEDGVVGATPADTTLLLAGLKAEAVADRLGPGTLAGTVVLGCDSLLDLDGVGYGKPGTAQEAVRRWRTMRGRSGVLHTGHCLIEPASGRRVAQTASTTVHFAALSDAEIDAYVGTGEPLAVAGGFTLDGLGGPFVTAICGDPHNVVGVSLPLLRNLLERLEVNWTALWNRP